MRLNMFEFISSCPMGSRLRPRPTLFVAVASRFPFCHFSIFPQSHKSDAKKAKKEAEEAVKKMAAKEEELVTAMEAEVLKQRHHRWQRQNGRKKS